MKPFAPALAHPRLRAWQVEWIAIAPEIGACDREALENAGVIPQSLRDLTGDLE